MLKRSFFYLALVLGLLITPGSALAQSLSFRVPRMEADVYWNEDGSSSIEYTIVFENDPFGAPIDYVDLGLPNSNFDAYSITASVDGHAVQDISEGDFQGEGSSGVAIGLGSRAIQPGETGTLKVFIPSIQKVLRPDTDDANYASAVFSPNYFGSQYLNGNSDITVTYHFPPGVQPDEPKWHSAPAGWQDQPATGFDIDGRILYSWRNINTPIDQAYLFGASFPQKYVPASAIIQESFLEKISLSADAFFGLLCWGSFGGFMILIVILSQRAARRRKLQYLPPRVSVEGHGIKRGLTAIEAALLLEQPMDKILTMILFATIKKNAATVLQGDPLKLEFRKPLPNDLQPYEVNFLEALQKPDESARKNDLQAMMIDLVKSVSNKMKGFSRKETVDYYRGIIQRAWEQVEAANTPQVKSELYEQVMDWTILDDDFDDRTRRVFRQDPVFTPGWWPRFDPSVGRAATMSAPATGGQFSMPHLPGADFAASMVNGVQNFAGTTVGNLANFTSGITQKTNPLPVTTSRGGGYRGGGGGGCACACACAGCACACAGGGR